MAANDQGVIGASVRRKEDYRFLTGAGQFTDDVNPPNQSTRISSARRTRTRRSARSTPARRKQHPASWRSSPATT